MSEVATPDITGADVRASIAVARSHGEKFFNEIVWQIENETWTLLGYASWDEMREAEYADMGVVAPRADRPEFVSRLRQKGFTQKQISQTLGVHRETVASDLRSMSETGIEPAAIVNARGQERPATYQRREPEPEPRFVSATTALASFTDAPAAEAPLARTGIGLSPIGVAASMPSPRETGRDARTMLRDKFQTAISGLVVICEFSPEAIASVADPADLGALRMVRQHLDEQIRAVERATSPESRGGIQEGEVSPEEYSDLLREAAYDASGSVRPTPRAVDALLTGLDDAEQAQREWAEHQRTRLLRLGAAQELHRIVASDKRMNVTDNAGLPAAKNRVRRIQRIEVREDGKAVSYFQPTLWEEMSRADLVQVKVREETAAQQREDNAKIAARLIDLCDQHGVFTVREALDALGLDDVEEVLAA